MRNATNQASQAEQNAANVGSTEQGNAAAIGGNLTPFLTSEMFHPQGYGQQGLSAMTAAAEGGAGGAASGLFGAANQRAAATHNAGSYQAALDEIARQRAKGAAASSENIAAQNEQLKQRQQQEGAEGLSGLYRTDTSAMLDAMGQEAPDINAEVNANKTGWLQNTLAILNTINGGANAAANLMKASKG